MNKRKNGKIYGMYFITGFDWSGDMAVLILYNEIRKLVMTAVIVNRLR